MRTLDTAAECGDRQVWPGRPGGYGLLVLAVMMGAHPQWALMAWLSRRMSGLVAKGFAVDRFGVLVRRPSCWRLLVVLMLCLTTAACAGKTAPSHNTPPGPVTGLSVSSTSIGDDWLSLSWTNPTGTDFTGVMVRRAVGAAAPTLKSGTLVSDFTDQADYVVDANLTPGTQYSYAFFAYDGAKNYSAATTVTGRTPTSPTRTK